MSGPMHLATHLQEAPFNLAYAAQSATGPGSGPVFTAASPSLDWRAQRWHQQSQQILPQTLSNESSRGLNATAQTGSNDGRNSPYPAFLSHLARLSRQLSAGDMAAEIDRFLSQYDLDTARRVRYAFVRDWKKFSLAQKIAEDSLEAEARRWPVNTPAQPPPPESSLRSPASFASEGNSNRAEGQHHHYAPLVGFGFQPQHSVKSLGPRPPSPYPDSHASTSQWLSAMHASTPSYPLPPPTPRARTNLPLPLGPPEMNLKQPSVGLQRGMATATAPASSYPSAGSRFVNPPIPPPPAPLPTAPHRVEWKGNATTNNPSPLRFEPRLADRGGTWALDRATQASQPGASQPNGPVTTAASDAPMWQGITTYNEPSHLVTPVAAAPVFTGLASRPWLTGTAPTTSDLAAGPILTPELARFGVVAGTISASARAPKPLVPEHNKRTAPASGRCESVSSYRETYPRHKIGLPPTIGRRRTLEPERLATSMSGPPPSTAAFPALQRHQSTTTTPAVPYLKSKRAPNNAGPDPDSSDEDSNLPLLPSKWPEWRARRRSRATTQSDAKTITTPSIIAVASAAKSRSDKPSPVSSSAHARPKRKAAAAGRSDFSAGELRSGLAAKRQRVGGKKNAQPRVTRSIARARACKARASARARGRGARRIAEEDEGVDDDGDVLGTEQRPVDLT